MKKPLLLLACVAFVSAEFLHHVIEYHNVCEEREFSCGNGTCIDLALKCDRIKDCPGGEDEDFCGSSKWSWECPSENIRCHDSGYCIPEAWKCNGEIDCSDGSDEKDCVKVVNGTCFMGDMEGFLCNNTECIRREFKCDRSNDCKDGSDELNCEGEYLQPKALPEVTSVLCSLDEGYFRCQDNQSCIADDRVCNNFPDCADHSDEGHGCYKFNHTDECRDCKFGCIRTPTGPFCKCPPGYVHTSTSQCRDVNECEELPDSCSQRCENLDGSFKCSCADDYSLMADMKSCQIALDYFDALVVYVADKQIRTHNMKTNETKVLVDTPAIGVSYDGFHCYWTEVTSTEARIMRIDVIGGKPEVVVDSGIELPEDITIDWVTGNIYFTDNELSRIGVCTSNGLHCTIIVENMTDKPRAIVLDPFRGQMYWSDWGNSPAIMRANMDGSDVTPFVTENVTWPNGLALDFPAQRLYWVDGHRGHIESIGLDGSGRHLVLKNFLHHPFWVGILENTLFWSDWQLEELVSCDKLNGKNRKTLDHGKIYGVDLYHPQLRVKPRHNGCQDHRCSHICLLKGADSHSCACPEEISLAKDGRACKESSQRDFLMVGGGKLLLKLDMKDVGRHHTTPAYLEINSIDALAYNHIQDSVYIYDKSWSYILSIEMKEFAKARFHYIHGKDLGKVEGMGYDYMTDALYWTDSQLRSVQVKSLRHDHTTVLYTFSDGLVPKSMSIAPQYGKMFIAVSEGNVIHIESLSLDGKEKKRVVDQGFIGPVVKLFFSSEHDLLFISDSANGYIATLHPEGTFRQVIRKTGANIGSITVLGSDIFWTAHDSKYLHHSNIHESSTVHSKTKLLDVFKDGLPQLHLLSTMSQAPRNNQTTLSHPCNVVHSSCSHICVQGGNSSGHGYTCLCPSDMFMRQNGVCEERMTCYFDNFFCHESNQCIESSLKCNNIQDCSNGEDERNCAGDMFQCQNGKEIPDSQVCNGINNCLDDSDEVHCKGKTAACESGQFVCGDGECVDRRRVCDTTNDCSDHTDENHLMCRSHTCDYSKEFRCSIGNCIPHQWECDGEFDCADGSDEHTKCRQEGPCRQDQFHCAFGGCIAHQLKCDGKNDCGDLSDEEDCPKDSELQFVHGCDEFACPTNRSICLPLSAICNNTSECPGSADEVDCRLSDVSCLDTEWQCRVDTECIPLVWVCDGKNDCRDTSDEHQDSCADRDPQWRPAVLQATSCRFGYACGSGECVDHREVCDGHNNCHDGSDEGGSCETACNDHKCSHICQKTPRGALCTCEPGFKLSNDSVNCQDIDECSQPSNPCSQTCRNTAGSYKCGCYDGFSLKPDGRTCKAFGAQTELLYLAKNEIRSVNVHGDRRRVVFRNTNIDFIHSIAAHFTRNTIYFTSETEGKLFIHDMSDNKTTHISNIGSPTKLSVDWLTGNVYFADNSEGSKKISVCDINVKRCAVVQTIEDENEVMSMAIDPVSSYLFFCTKRKNPHQSTVYRTELNGANVRQIWTSDVKKCNGMTLDVHKKMLFVAGNRIYISNYDGSARKQKGLPISCSNYSQSYYAVFHSTPKTQPILADSTDIKRPAGISYFEDHIYMISSESTKLTRCSLYMDHMCSWISLHEYQSRGFVVYQEMVERPAAKNPCDEMFCYGVCVTSLTGPHCLPQLHDENGVMALFSDNPQRSTSRRLTSVIVGVVLCGLSLLAVSPFLYHFWTTRAKKEHIPVHFQNPIYGESIPRIPEPVVTITTPRNNNSYNEIVNPLERYIQGAWKNINKKIKKPKKPQVINESLEIPDHDSDAESDRDMESKENTKLIK